MKNNNGWFITTLFLLGCIALLGGFSGHIQVMSFDPLRACIISLIFAVIVLLLQVPVLLNNWLEKNEGKTK